MKLDYRKTLLLGLGFLGVSALWGIYTAFVPTFLDQKFHLSPLWIGFFLTLDNITALFVQPPIGVWSDKLRTPIGRRMPFILVGAPLGALAFALVPLAPVLPLFLMCTGTLLVAMALWRTPVMALMADVTPPALRSPASGVISFMGGVGGIIAYFGAAPLFRINSAYPFYLGAAVVLVAASLLLLFVKEPKQYTAQSTEVSEAQPGFLASLSELFNGQNQSALCLLGALVCLMVGYTAVEGFFSLYTLNHLGWDAGKSSVLLGLVSLIFVIFAIPSGNLGARIGRRRTIMAGLILMAALIALIHVTPVATLKKSLFSVPGIGAISVIAIMLMGVGLAWALVIIHPLPMLSTMVDNSRVGTYTGLYYGFTSLAAIIGPILNGWVVEVSGKNYNSVMLFAPFAFAFAWLLMWGVREPPNSTLDSLQS